MMARQLILMRHAAMAPEYSGRYVGSTDLPIATGQDPSIRTTARWLEGRGIGSCWCSTLHRARQTAQIVRRHVSYPIQYDDALREVDFGQWECRSFAEISLSHPQEVAQWASLPDDFAFPGGEMWPDFLARIDRVSQLLIQSPDDVVLAITHGGVIRSLICRLLGLDARNYLLFNVHCCGCCVIDLYDGKGVLGGLNLPGEEPQEGN